MRISGAESLQLLQRCDGILQHRQRRRLSGGHAARTKGVRVAVVTVRVVVARVRTRGCVLAVLLLLLLQLQLQLLLRLLLLLLNQTPHVTSTAFSSTACC